jgi:hypothetical protein
MTLMNAVKIFLQAGAWICGLIGLFFMAEIAVLLFAGSFTLLLISPLVFSLFAFIPFIAFVLPKEKPPRKLVFLSIALIEILILGFCLWSILCLLF